MIMRKIRLDELLIQKNLAADRKQAQILIVSGNVTVAGERVRDFQRRVDLDCPIEIIAEKEFASRGGNKLAEALEYWQISVSDWIVLDIGSSTGGFTDCLLKQGASQVYCVDVGTNQMIWRLRNDPQVQLFERT